MAPVRVLNRAGSDVFEGTGASITIQNADGRRTLVVWTDGASWYTSERRFKSAAQTITFGSRYTLAHGLGARTVVGPMDIEGAGRMTILQDPQGAIFAIFKSMM